MTNPIEDTLWMRAFWEVRGKLPDDAEFIEFSDVDKKVIEWSKMPTNQLGQMLSGCNQDD